MTKWDEEESYDGLSIAWAAYEYISESHRKIRTLFATHYHEMTALEDERRGIMNFNVDVAKRNGQCRFLHKIVRGSASRSYGIHVADIAGVPHELLERAGERLAELEGGNTFSKNDMTCEKHDSVHEDGQE
ncbi:MAG: hypothetical protein V8Q42_03830 [Anaerovoracaceae bacterium]